MADWTGFRPDSAPAIEGGDKIIAWWKSRGRDPRDKLLIFSDGLDVDMIEVPSSAPLVAQLADVHQPLDAGLQRHEGAEVGDLGDLARHLAALGAHGLEDEYGAGIEPKRYAREIGDPEMVAFDG